MAQASTGKGILEGMKKYALLCLVLVVGIGVYAWLKPSHAKAPSTKPAATFNKKKYSLSDPSSPWVVVNKKRPLSPLQYAPTDLVQAGNPQLLRSQAADALAAMLDDAQKAGYTLTPESGYRSFETQQIAYNSEVNGFGQQYADKESARPGYSEHQTGWAVDLGSDNCNVQDCFGSTPGGKWAVANAYKYGFILRYPADKTTITGYRNEAWHFRYVGKELSTEMHNKHIATLEEFFGLPAAPNY
ncbi:MAG TPA: M15 family metallopeptidase [Candidatus Saccharimonadales bacterium]|nr:M15 family metallopeptidase [Candidatus Saccharimonadales bacterium]